MSLRRKNTAKPHVTIKDPPTPPKTARLTTRTEPVGILKRSTSLSNRPPTPKMSLSEIRKMNLADEDSEDEDQIPQIVQPPSPPRRSKQKKTQQKDQANENIYDMLTLKLTAGGLKLDQANKAKSPGTKK